MGICHAKLIGSDKVEKRESENSAIEKFTDEEMDRILFRVFAHQLETSRVGTPQASFGGAYSIFAYLAILLGFVVLIGKYFI